MRLTRKTNSVIEIGKSQQKFVGDWGMYDFSGVPQTESRVKAHWLMLKSDAVALDEARRLCPGFTYKIKKQLINNKSKEV